MVGVGENTVFGYGSLISRGSFSARFTEELVEDGIVGVDELVEMNVLRDESELGNYTSLLKDEGMEDSEAEETALKMLLESTVRTETNSAYDSGEFGTDTTDRKKADLLWRELEEEQAVVPVPVKIPGQRGYWLDSIRGGTMLTADPSDEERMNGVVYVGVTEAQKDALEADEGDEYDMLELDWDEVEVYAPEKTRELLEERGVEEPEELSIFYGDNSSPYVDKTTARARNSTYHEGVENAIENQIAELYGEETAREFLEDFRSTTYENPVSGAPNMFQDEIDRLESEGREEEAREYRQKQDAEVKRFANTVEQSDSSIKGFETLIESIEEDYRSR